MVVVVKLEIFSIKHTPRVQITVTIIKETTKALLVNDFNTNNDDVWLPRSQLLIESKADNDDFTLIQLPLWLAKECNLPFSSV